MRNNGKGGMTTTSVSYTLYCPKCGRPAARKECFGEKERYLHFTRKGSVWHRVEIKQEVQNNETD